jgi:Domain of unknown function (DUF4124)
MHLRPLLIATMLLGALSAEAGVIYKWKDANGVTHYSDQPSPGAERMIVSSAPTIGSTRSAGATARTPAGARPPQSGEPQSPLAYDHFEIFAPQANATYTAGLPIDVRIRIEPSLRGGQTVSLYLDGKRSEASSDSGKSFVLENVERGSHLLTAVILDRASGETHRSESVPFVVFQKSVAAPPRGPLIKPRK